MNHRQNEPDSLFRHGTVHLIRIKANPPFVAVTPDEYATVAVVLPDLATVVSVSPGDDTGSLPSGEIEPSVTLAYALGESFPDFQSFLKRKHNAHARAA